MNPESEVIADSSELNPAAVEQLDELVQLLVDLEVIETLPIAPMDLDDVPIVPKPADLARPAWPRLDSPKAAPQPLLHSAPPATIEPGAPPLLLPCSQSDVMHRGLYNFPFLYPLSAEPPEELAAPSATPAAELSEAPLTEDSIAAFQRLQALLVGPELSQLQDLDATAAAKLARLEQQIYDREELIQLLLPTIAELLSRKSKDAKDELVNAIAPIIDQVIQTRNQTHQSEMGLAFAPILPVAIAEQIQNSPEIMVQILAPIIDQVIQARVQTHQSEMGLAFAPILPVAIAEQIQNSPEIMVQTLAPIIDQVIQARAQTHQSEMGLTLAPVLSVAIAEQVRNSPDEIADAIAPVMGLAIKKQLELDRNIVIDALYPIIGGTVAKYFAEMLRSINQKLEQAMSPVGLKRKIQAKLQGVSEAELILRESMPFTVQTIFLIHKISGLVIAEVHHENHETLEIDMVAGMLTAIRSFVNDCFAQSGSISELDQIDYGTSKIILEAAGFCYLAVVVEGDPPAHWVQHVHALFSHLISEYDDPIAKFEGDPATVPPRLISQLSGLLDVTAAAPPRSQGAVSPLMILGGGLLGLIAIPWGIHAWISSTHQRVETAAVSALMAEPSLSVYHVMPQVQQGRLKLSGRLPNETLRQRAEQIVRAKVPTWPIDNQILAVDVPPDPELTKAEVQRATTLLNQLDGINITAQYADDRISVSGDVMQATQVVQVMKAFEQIPGVKTVSSAIAVKPWQINIRFYFPTGSATLNAFDHTTKLLVIKSLLNQYPKLHLNLVGYETPKASTKGDLPLAKARARAVQAALIQQGIQASRLHVSGRGDLPPAVSANQPTWLSRCVVLELVEPSQ